MEERNSEGYEEEREKRLLSFEKRNALSITGGNRRTKGAMKDDFFEGKLIQFGGLGFPKSINFFREFFFEAQLLEIHCFIFFIVFSIVLFNPSAAEQQAFEQVMANIL